MRRAAPPHVKLKAAGGVRNLRAVIEVAELGCDRIGASRTAEILEELKARLHG
jgi:deoxyribose-phosphate aldolase